jgi:hypothetical protein
LQERGHHELFLERLAVCTELKLLANKTAWCSFMKNLGHCGCNQDNVSLTSGFQKNRFSGNVVTILLHPKPSYWLETP